MNSITANKHIAALVAADLRPSGKTNIEEWEQYGIDVALETVRKINILAQNKAYVTSSATDNNWRKCKHCGKFISYKQMEEQKDVMFHFIPDSEITTEEAYWVHRHCW